MRLSLRFALLGVAVASASFAAATTTYTNYDSYFGYNTSVAWNVTGGASITGPQDFGEEFTASVTGTLSDIILPVSMVSGVGTYGVQLYSNSGGALGSVIDSWTGVNTNGSFGANNPSTLLAGSPSVHITAGTSYWVVVSPTGASTSTLYGTWNDNSTGATGNAVYSTNYGTTWNYMTGQPLAALQVDVNPPAAPEPLSVLALVGGAASLIRRRRR